MKKTMLIIGICMFLLIMIGCKTNCLNEDSVAQYRIDKSLDGQPNYNGWETRCFTENSYCVCEDFFEGISHGKRPPMK